jgi:Endonuclease/Exonuclease/phosphatase family
MPTITYMSWNIQEFGDGIWGNYGGSYTARCQFIAAVAAKQMVDIFVIQELTRAGVSQLHTLRDYLTAVFHREGVAPEDNNWFYDWVPASYRAGGEGPNSNRNSSQELNWEGQANGEGYAVFWRHNPDKFRMLLVPEIEGRENTQSGGVRPRPLPTGVPKRVLTLVWEGRHPRRSHPWEVYAPGVDPNNNNAYKWGDLNFVGNGGSAERPNACRRPCFFTIDLNLYADKAERYVPIVVYHGPSATNVLNAPATGIRLAAFSRQMFMAPDRFGQPRWLYSDRVIASGDYNVDGNPESVTLHVQEAYNSFTNNFSLAEAGGANCKALVPLGQDLSNNCTIVSVSYNPAMYIPIEENHLGAYLTAQLDNVFYRGFVAERPPMGSVPNLLMEVMYGNLTGELVRSFLLIIDEAIKDAWMIDGKPQILDPKNPDRWKPVYPQILNWNDFYAGLERGSFSSARTAAEFIFHFISDHLPLVLKFTVED